MHNKPGFEEVSTIIWAIAAIFIGLALFIILFTILFTRRKNKLIKDKLRMQSEFQQTLLQAQIEIQEQTLKTISQEIHDNIGQVLSLAKLNLNTFEKTENITNQTKIDNTKQLVSKAIVDLRHLSRSMYGDQLQELGLPAAIDNELTILQNTKQYKTQLEVKGDVYKMEPQKETIIYRMVQEAINNCIKHARAKKIIVNLLYESDNFSLNIQDDGIGFDPKALSALTNGMGLKSMQNRASMIGGACTIQTEINKGTMISFSLPTTNINH